MALNRKAPCVAIVWTTDTESLSANTRTFGRDRIVSWTLLPDASGDVCALPAATTALRVAAPLPEAAACLWSPEDAAGALAFQGRGAVEAPAPRRWLRPAP